MSRKDRMTLDHILDKAREVMPPGTRVFLYGSRARGDARQDSDWDILILVKEHRADINLYDTLAYPLTEIGWRYGEVVSPIIYSQEEWDHPASLLFRRSVEQDAISLI